MSSIWIKDSTDTLITSDGPTTIRSGDRVTISVGDGNTTTGTMVGTVAVADKK